MIRSMTGYGRARETRNGRDITVEVRSVNNRYLDVAVRLPRPYIFAEDKVRTAVQRFVARGKVDVFVTVDSLGTGETSVTVNEPLARSYMAALEKLCQLGNGGTKAEYGAADLARFPDVLVAVKAEEDMDTVSGDLCAVLEEALSSHTAMRASEGQRLCDDILDRLATIESLTGQIEKRSPQTVAEYREKLTARMREVLQAAGVDENRILMEAAVYADKTAVAEETVRLRSHAAQVREMLDGGGPVGRKLDFLIQEANREANTIGSKCGDLEVTRMVVALKAEIEKIREQVQNLE